ncbi:hypothetical protein [Streptomyces albipurpureus]|uniref:hypothetical protein n=1 Tax=Streptomyces albipurpureus TaxID=2897419 RepID=UPI0027E58312|nr:hypothetical protein [Streptomyces sp. CWNU-1]
MGYIRGGSLNLHEPGAVRALLDMASARGWQRGQRRAVEIDGWPLLEAAAATRAGSIGPADF